MPEFVLDRVIFPADYLGGAEKPPHGHSGGRLR